MRGDPPEKRFFDFFIPEPMSGCWLWEGGVTGSGYGRFQRQQAHRYSWELHKGPIPDGLLVCHHCDVRPCVNPDHLFLGTQSENLADMVSKGRENPPRGENSWRARLSESDITAIRADGRVLRVIGEQYGIDRQYVWHIKHGRYWAHSHDGLHEVERDRQARGKLIRAKGENHHGAKLTEADVRAIRIDSRSGSTVAREYGVSKHNILEIRRRRIWKHVI